MKFAFPILALVALSTGCNFDVASCSSDDDCPAGTSCFRPSGTDYPVCIAPDEPTVEPADQNNAPDKDDGSRPQNSTSLDCPEVDGCGADEPNDDYETAVLLDQSTLGCAGFGVERWSTLRQDEACGGDVDQFYLEYYPCEESTFDIVLTLETREACADAGVLELLENRQCDDDGVTCGRDDRGHQTVSVRVDRHRFPQPLKTLDFAVRPRDPDLGVEYILRARVDR